MTCRIYTSLWRILFACLYLYLSHKTEINLLIAVFYDSINISIFSVVCSFDTRHLSIRDISYTRLVYFVSFLWSPSKSSRVNSETTTNIFGIAFYFWRFGMTEFFDLFTGLESHKAKWISELIDFL